MDALVNHTICKHIHLIAGNDKPTEGPNINKNTLSHDDLLINETHLSLEETAIPKQHKHNEIKIRLQQKLTTLMSQIQKVTNDEALLSAEKNINAAISVLHVINTSDTCTFNQLLPTKHSPENKRITPQRGFFSTKCKCKKTKTKIAKPSTIEKENIKQALVDEMPLYSPFLNKISKLIALLS